MPDIGKPFSDILTRRDAALSAPVISLIVTGIGFLLGLFSATYLALRLADVAIINDHLEDLKAIEALAISYWLDEGETSEQREAAGHKLRGRLHATVVFRARHSSVLGFRDSEYAVLDGELFDAVTGGSFQSKSYKPDPERAVLVVEICNRLRSLLRSTRKDVYWFR